MKLAERLVFIDRAAEADLATIKEAAGILKDVEQWLEAKVALGEWSKPPSAFARDVLRRLKKEE